MGCWNKGLMAPLPNELIGHNRNQELQEVTVGVISVTVTKSDPTLLTHAAPTHRSAEHSETMEENL